VPKLETESVDVPDSVCLVVANSLTPAAKLLTLGTHYNKRVVECRLAVALLAFINNLTTDFMEPPVTTLQ